jgi:hypothetical protein
MVRLQEHVGEGCDIFFSEPPVYKEGTSYWATNFLAEAQEHQVGRVTAIEPLTGKTEVEVSALFFALGRDAYDGREPSIRRR